MASQALGVLLSLATVLLCLATTGQAQSTSRLLYDEGNVGGEYSWQPANYNYDVAGDTGDFTTSGYEDPMDGQVRHPWNFAYQETGVQGDVSLAGFDMDETPGTGGEQFGDKSNGTNSPPPPEHSSPPPPRPLLSPPPPRPLLSPPPPLPTGGCGSGNQIDDCWRCDPDWASHRQSLATCAAGFGRSAIGGKNGKIYVVTSPTDDDPANPAPGTLRYGTTRDEPLWIIFESSMTIKLKLELFVTSFKTIDGRGATVHITGGAGLKLNKVSNIILHNIAVHDIKVTGPGKIMMSQNMVQKRNKCDGDAVTIYGAKNIWVDHCYFAKAADGLVDITKASDGVTISNNYFTNHNKVMLCGADPADTFDKDMHVTVAYNVFGPNCVQRMPRVRYGFAHVVNNYYPVGWKQYAVGGSEGPTILSQGNVYNALNSGKQVSKRINDGGPKMGGPETWNWRSEGDEFYSKAYWAGIAMKWSDESYTKTISCSARPASMVPAMTKDAGPLNCKLGSRCG